MVILNVVCMGKFFLDCIIWEYVEDIWVIKFVVIELEDFCFDG